MTQSARLPAAQSVGFCRSADGTRIAYARYGEGPPLVVSTCWLSHLEYDLQSPVWKHFVHGLAERVGERPVRRARLRALRLGRDRLLLREAAAGPGGRGGRGRAGPVRAAGDVPGRSGGRRLRAAAPGAGDPAGAARQLRRDGRRRLRGVPPARGDLHQDDRGRLGPPGGPVPAGVHRRADARRHAGADDLGRRADAPVDDHRERRRVPPGPDGRRRLGPAAAPRRTDAGDALPRRPDEPARGRPPARCRDPRRAAGHPGDRQPRAAGRRAGDRRVLRRARGVPGAGRRDAGSRRRTPSRLRRPQRGRRAGRCRRWTG